MGDSSELFSIYSSISSSTRTTVPGLGYLSGRAIKRLGEVVLNGVDNVLVNRQLGRIETSVKADNAWHEDTPSSEIKQMCGILLELSHPGYPFSIRTRALRIIMTLIGSMTFIGLATTLVDLNSTSKLHRHFCDVLDCLQDSKSEIAFRRKSGDETTRKRLSALRAAGYESYVAAFPGQARSKLLLLSPFILYLTLIAVLGDSHHTRLILSEELNVVRFLLSLGLSDKDRGGAGITAGRLFMEVHRLRLDHVADDGLVSVVENAIFELSMSLEAGDSLTDYMWAQFEPGTAAPPSYGFLMNAVAIVRHQLTKSGTYSLSDPSGDGLNLRNVKVLLIGGGCGGKTTIMKQLIFAHHGLASFMVLYEPATYLEMMESQIKTFLHTVVKYFLVNPSLNSDQWARWDINQNFDKLPPTWSPFMSQSERLLKLHDFFRTNITTFSDLCSALASTPDYALDMGAGYHASSPPLDHLGHLLEALHGMVSRSRRRALAPISAELEPTYLDLLGWYICTTGVHQESFTTQKNSYTFWDCGGQRSERKKWSNYVPQTDVVLFVVSLIEYDRVLSEDHSVNGMDDSLELFKSIYATTGGIIPEELGKCPLILVFNQMDLLAEKLERSPLQNHFSDYDGGSDTNAACEYIKNKFLEHLSPEQKVSVHFMSALDPKDVDALFARVQKEYAIHKFTTQGIRRNSRTSIVMGSG
ncbi:guanine nucleotide-binding protein subunit alpha [Marasmius tenuissimus]|nr:guanine nucleotide-binding protein subunit alpha [Marasmius tenuissimus]